MNETDFTPHIVSEWPDAVAVWKPHGMPTAPLSAEETDTLVNWVGARFPETLRVRGAKTVEGGVLHRLDTATAGLVLFARSQTAWDEAHLAAERGLFRKVYHAECEWCTDSVLEWPFCGGRGARIAKNGTPIARTAPLMPGETIASAFRAWGPGRRRVAPQQEGTPLYVTTVESVVQHEIEDGETRSLWKISVALTRGFRHQVRVHLSMSGFPIRGDTLYHPTPAGEILQLRATGIELSLPGRTLAISSEE